MLLALLLGSEKWYHHLFTTKLARLFFFVVAEEMVAITSSSCGFMTIRTDLLDNKKDATTSQQAETHAMHHTHTMPPQLYHKNHSSNNKILSYLSNHNEVLFFKV
jgi:hypothetical protein